LTPLSPQQLRAQSEQVHSPEAVTTAITRLSVEITQVLQDLEPVVLCVMSGGLIFTGQLLTQLNFPLEIDYVHASRYQNKTIGLNLDWKVLPQIDLSGRNVLIVDDILDEGITMLAIRDKCLALGAKAVLSAVLVEKQLAHEKPIRADFVGLVVPNRYVFGSGMDAYGWWRNLAGIYALNQS